MILSNGALWRSGLVLLLAGLVSCGSPRAPIRDQGRAFPDQGPEIVRGGGPVDFQPPSDSTSSARLGTHRVRDGDTLVAIAFMYGLDFRELAAANNLSPPYTIYVGQELALSANRSAAASPAGVNGGIRRRSIGQSASVPVPESRPDSSRPSGSSSAGWQWPLADRGTTNFRPDINNRLDIEGKAGDSVVAARDGEVVYSRPFGNDSGTLLIIRHDDRFLSAYTQTGRVLVDNGDRVSAGQAIVELEPADSGSPMVYFNVQRDGAFVDPTSLLP